MLLAISTRTTRQLQLTMKMELKSGDSQKKKFDCWTHPFGNQRKNWHLQTQFFAIIWKLLNWSIFFAPIFSTPNVNKIFRNFTDENYEQTGWKEKLQRVCGGLVKMDTVPMWTDVWNMKNDKRPKRTDRETRNYLHKLNMEFSIIINNFIKINKN